ncbi:hypothetical protein [Wenzhouxiangella sp. XN24]|uniref:hypothetical protein n=1 Tax=Wenzhouxiangella sp. XN24 TaxID=2713569 RepID=UPI0013ED0D0A|nr:hypothetical protein [Wenzhouxiangella sp. XN24]NGX17704.1 hypothetical protein [Wenzhouxiangella sp. XN24]
MSEHKFEYGPVARGTYMALVWLVILTAIVFPELLLWHLLLILFLGLGLRPLLEKTGLYDLYAHVTVSIAERLDRKFVEERRREIERNRRRKMYRRFGKDDPRLPKNW